MKNNNKIAARLTSPIVLLLLATLLAGGVAGLAYMYLQQREASIQSELNAKSRKAQVPKVAVVVPMRDAAIGTVLNGATFVSRQIETDLVYPDTVLAKDFPSLEGQKLARPVLRGRPVRMTDLLQPHVNDVAAILPAGMRAVTIDIDNLNSIAQTLRPHHRVDIFLLSKTSSESGRGPTENGEQASLFMQDMIVLATGQEFQDLNQPVENTNKMVRPGEMEGVRDKGFDTVTLLVKPAEAARLLVGQKMGSYRVVLRGTRDRDALAMAPLRSIDLGQGGVRKRDAGIEFIVGGRGDQIVSRLHVPPSQLAPPSALPVSAPDTPATANQPIPILRGSK